MREQLTWALCKIDQFKVLSVAEQQSVDRLPRQWVSVLRRCRATPLTAHSLDDIQSATHEYLQSIESLCSDPFRPQPVSEEYSAEVQLRVLHLTLDEIAEPVLDIGCGKDALLVHWLRCQQLNAIGIDLCGNPSRGGVAADWFEFPFVPAYFGTIIAHLSFSLQFLRHHLDPKGDAQRFAKQYMNILRSLKVGGRLVYTPGLPFLEQHLPRSNYSVTRYPIEDLPQDSQGAELYARQLGDDPLYACHVRRQ
jgi:SAM-dependent methyltransferase